MTTTPAEEREPVEAQPEDIQPVAPDALAEPTAEPAEAQPDIEPVDEPHAALEPESEPVDAEIVPEPAAAAGPGIAPAAADSPVGVTEPEPVETGQLFLDEVEPEAPSAPDLDALDATPVQRASATNLDLPSLELPHPAPEPARQVPPAPPAPAPYPGAVAGGDYTQNLAQSAYGQPAPQPAPTPTAQPSPPPFAPSPYSTPAAPPQAQYSQPTYGQPTYGQPAYGQPAYGQMEPYSQLSPTDESTWSTAAHWSAILASVVGLGFLGPLLVMLIQGPKSARVRANAVESLNFEITFIIAMAISILLMLLIIGFITTPILGILWLVLRIVASVQTSSGQDYRYPVTLRLVK